MRVDRRAGRRSRRIAPLIAEPYGFYQVGFDVSWELDLWGRISSSIEQADADIARQRRAARPREGQPGERRRAHLLRCADDPAPDPRSRVRRSPRCRTGCRYRGAGRRRLGRWALVRASTSRPVGAEGAAADRSWRVRRRAATRSHCCWVTIPAHSRAALAAGTDDADRRCPTSRSDCRRSSPPPTRHRARPRRGCAAPPPGSASPGQRSTRASASAPDSGPSHIWAAHFLSWGSRLWSFGPSLDLPLFDRGRRKSVVQLRELEQQEAAVAYQRTVLRHGRRLTMRSPVIPQRPNGCATWRRAAASRSMPGS